MQRCLCESCKRDVCKWKPLRMDWRGSSRSTEKRFYEQNVLLVCCSSYGRASEHALSPGRGVSVFQRVFCVWSVHGVRNVLSTKVHCPLVHLAHHAKRARAFEQGSVRKVPQISWRSEIDLPKVLKEARRCQSVRKLFSLSLERQRSVGEVARPHTYMGISVFDRSMTKSVRVRSSFGQAGEPTIWRQNDRARNKAL